MHGPNIFVRTLSVPNVEDTKGRLWQYHPQSDHHSKVACWAMLFDLLGTCSQLREHVKTGKVGFGINHEMREFSSGRKKNLDLVLCTRGSGSSKKKFFADLVAEYPVLLDKDEKAILGGLPVLERMPVGSVLLALEAKACMTEHIKALPRLYDELNSSHAAIHGASDQAIAAGFAVVNFSERFISPGRNKHGPKVETTHKQPNVTIRTIEKLKEIPRRLHGGAIGFDALGIVVVNLTNDGDRVMAINEPPAPEPSDPWHYDQMIRRICSLYSTKFANI